MFSNLIHSTTLPIPDVRSRASDDFSTREELQFHEVEPIDKTLKCTSFGSHKAGDRWVFVPKILLQGKWLEQFGFSKNVELDVHVELGEITIRIAHEQ
ncbi:MAG: SymE family type I addiction module toxin [Bacteroidota bacterium]